MAVGQRGFGELPVAAKVFILILLLGVATAAYFFLLHSPLVDDVESLDRQYRDLTARREAAEQRQQEFLRVNGELASRQALDRQNRRTLPEDAEIPAFLQDLNRLGELSALEFRLVEPEPEEQVGVGSPEETPANQEQAAPAAAGVYARIPVSLRLRGRFHQVAKFFYNVGELDRAINLENVNLANPTVQGEEVFLDVEVTATTFRRFSAAELEALATAPTEAAQ
jgi:type IV pilus assembly protein PilO